MDKILALVEGQTEETFIRDLLAPHLVHFGKCIVPTVVVTKRVKVGPDFKGGIHSYGQVKRDLLRLIGDSSATKITTMLDYYRLPSDFPGYADLSVIADAASKARHLEAALVGDLGDNRFVPYLSLHEYEALLFVDPASADWVYDDKDVVDQLITVRCQFGNQPELINDGPTTAPSKRMESIFPRYQKPLHGPMAAQAAGLQKLRADCPHFGAWLTELEAE